MIWGPPIIAPHPRDELGGPPLPQLGVFAPRGGVIKTKAPLPITPRYLQRRGWGEGAGHNNISILWVYRPHFGLPQPHRPPSPHTPPETDISAGLGRGKELYKRG